MEFSNFDRQGYGCWVLFSADESKIVFADDPLEDANSEASDTSKETHSLLTIVDCVINTGSTNFIVPLLCLPAVVERKKSTNYFILCIVEQKAITACIYLGSPVLPITLLVQPSMLYLAYILLELQKMRAQNKRE